MSNQPVQAEGGLGDKVKVACAVASILAGICGFYFLAGHPSLARVGVLIAGVVVGAGFIWCSSSGRNFVAFARESVRETKKVVWPARNDAIRVTGIVFGFVLLMAIFLWGADKVLEFVLYNILLGWKR